MFRRSSPPAEQPSRSLSAAAVRIPLATERGTGSFESSPVRKAEQWQTDAWAAYDVVGQVKATYNFIGLALMRIRLFPAAQVDEDSPPVHVDDASKPREVDGETVEPAITEDLADAIREELARLRSDIGGQAEIQRLFGLCLGVGGECYLIGRNAADETGDEPGDNESWDVYSTLELHRSTAEGKLQIIEAEGSTKNAIDLTDNDVVVRVWRRHAAWKQRADSHMRAALTDCDEILAMSRAFQATMQSRNNAGILCIPDELSAGSYDETGQSQSTAAEDDPLTRAIIESLVTPVNDPGSASAVVPHFLRGKGEWLDKVKHIKLERDLSPIAADERGKAIERLAQALPVPPEVVTGKADVNHWTSWQIAEETYQAYVEPEAMLMVDALLDGVIRPALRDRGFDAASVRAAAIGLDPSELVVHPNRAGDAKEAHEKFVLSNAALLRELGFAETDLPSDEELVRRVAVQRGIFTADLTTELLKLAELIPAALKLPEPSSNGSPNGSPAEPAEDEDETPIPDEPEPTDEEAAALLDAVQAALVADGQPTSVGRALVDIDRAVRERLTIAADDALRRVLDRAAARVRSRAQRDAAAKRAAREQTDGTLLAALGPSQVAELGLTEADLVPDDSFDGRLRERFDAEVSRAQRAALDAVEAESDLGGQRAVVEAAQDEDREAGWLVLAAALVALARARLFSTAPADFEGEIDTSLAVPPSIVREALSVAGGAPVAQVANTPGVPAGAGAGAARRLLDAAGRPAGGIATGQRLREALSQAGLAIGGWRWRYGDPSARARNFEPHRALDGVAFRSWEAPVLRVGSEASWVPTGNYYPGDHRGCRCDFEPIVAVAVPEPAV